MSAMRELRDAFGSNSRFRALSASAAALFLSLLAAAVMFVPGPAPLALLAGAAGVAAFFLRPAPVLLGFFVLRIWLDLLWWLPFKLGSLNLMELYTGGVTALCGVLFLLEIRRVASHPALPFFAPYVLVLIVGGARNFELRSAVEIFARYLSPLLVGFLVAGFMDTRERRRRFFIVTTLVCAVPVALSVFHLLNGQMRTYTLAGYNRLLGGYKNLHGHALSMFLIAAMATWWWFEAQTRTKRAAIALYGAAAAVCLYFTYVRTGLLALGIFGATLLWIEGRQRLLFAGGLAVAVFVLLNPAMQDRFKDFVLILAPDENVLATRKLGSGRFGIWSAAIGEYLRQSPLDIVMGLGIGGHFLLTREAFNPYSMASDGNVDAHSDYLTMTFQVGPVATLSYLAMQVQAMRCGLDVHRRSPDPFMRRLGAFVVAMSAGATIANVVSNSFINRITQSWMFWSLCGLVFAEWMALRREGRLRAPAPARRAPAPDRPVAAPQP